ncbi:hypothetical protein AB2B38_006150 [Balneola sp. MJW-20]|uniref:hypothetical protein n=1 Tax=Gracilimonas aurantiaca TaxID=3234185 RepID=UPI0034655DE5
MKLNKLITSVLFIVLLFLTSESAFAQANGIGGNLGAGIMLGEPSGITLKKWNNQRSAFDVGVAWSFSGNNDALLLQGDYLIHNWFNDIDEGRLAWYYGIGGRVVFANDAVVGARIPIGLNYLISDQPIGLFAEVAPILDLVPDTEFNGNGAIGIRYYF